MDPDGDLDDRLLCDATCDLAAFERFYRRHLDRMVRWAARRTSDPADVADLVADVFVAVIESSARFDPRRGSALPWLYGIAANVWATRLRRDRRDGALAARVAGRRLLDDDDIVHLEARIDAERQRRELLAAMAALPTSQRQVLELVAVDGLRPVEAAQALGVPPVTVRMRLSRARRRLRGRLTDPDGDARRREAPSTGREEHSRAAATPSIGIAGTTREETR